MPSYDGRDGERKRANERFRKMVSEGVFGNLLAFESVPYETICNETEAEKNRNEEMSGFWKSKDGRKVLIRDMDEQWLCNAIDYLAKKANEKGCNPSEYHPKYDLLIAEMDRRKKVEKTTVEIVKMKLQRRLEKRDEIIPDLKTSGMTTGRTVLRTTDAEATDNRTSKREEVPRKKVKPNKFNRAIDLD